MIVKLESHAQKHKTEYDTKLGHQVSLTRYLKSTADVTDEKVVTGGGGTTSNEMFI